MKSELRLTVLYHLFQKSRENRDRAILSALYHLANDEIPDLMRIAESLETARKSDIPWVVKLQEELSESEFLKEENLLRDDLINGHVLNAIHKLERLYLIQTTGKDPEKNEVPIISLKDCEVKMVNIRRH